MTPADIGFAFLQRLFFLIAFAHFLLIQTRFQHQHGFRAIAMLGAVVLALHHDIGGKVRNAHCRIGLVDVLAARARRAISVDAQIRRVDLDVDGFVHLRVNKYAGERRVAAIAGVEWGLAHQAVNAGLCAQIAIGVIAGNF